MTSEDPFDGAATVPGLEHLGRAIVDANGSPSGSPANFEYTRGATAEPTFTEEEKQAIVAKVAADFEAMMAPAAEQPSTDPAGPEPSV